MKLFLALLLLASHNLCLAIETIGAVTIYNDKQSFLTDLSKMYGRITFQEQPQSATPADQEGGIPGVRYYDSITINNVIFSATSRNANKPGLTTLSELNVPGGTNVHKATFDFYNVGSGNLLIPGLGAGAGDLRLNDDDVHIDLSNASLNANVGINAFGANFGSVQEPSPCCVIQSFTLHFASGTTQVIRFEPRDDYRGLGHELPHSAFTGFIVQDDEIIGITMEQFGHTPVLDSLVWGSSELCKITEDTKLDPGRITGFGDCTVGKKNPKWGEDFSYQPNGTLIADSGEKMELFCDDFEGRGPSFQLFYTTPAGISYRVGLCPFEKGCNRAWFTHTGDNNGDGTPDCIVSTQWSSADFGENDLPNPWTDEISEYDLDLAIMKFDARHLFIDKISDKYEYATPPPLDCKTDKIAKEGGKTRSTVVDPPVGPETEAFFDEVLRRGALVPREDGPMSEDLTKTCDINEDGDCDADDVVLFDTLVGLCQDNLEYRFEVDIDMDGCITEKDREMIFPATLEGDINNDGNLDESDYTAFIATFGLCEGQEGYNANADYDNDNCITFVDYQTWYGFFINQSPPG